MAPVLLGCFKIGLAVTLGSSLTALLRLFPGGLLGAMLLFSGVELAAAARRLRGARGWAFCLLTACGGMALENTGAGFAFGYACWVAVQGYERVLVPGMCALWRHAGGM